MGVPIQLLSPHDATLGMKSCPYLSHSRTYQPYSRDTPIGAHSISKGMYIVRTSDVRLCRNVRLTLHRCSLGKLRSAADASAVLSLARLCNTGHGLITPTPFPLRNPIICHHNPLARLTHPQPLLVPTSTLVLIISQPLSSRLHTPPLKSRMPT